jgi:hypothetical protein
MACGGVVVSQWEMFAGQRVPVCVCVCGERSLRALGAIEMELELFRLGI